jgi:hypothetical protein
MAQKMATLEIEAATAERLKARAAARGVTVPELLADLVPEEEPVSEVRNGTGRARTLPPRLPPGERARWLANAEEAARRLKDDPREQALLDEVEDIQAENAGILK